MKVIFISNIYGDFNSIYNNLSKIIDKQGSFDIIILNGNVFNDFIGELNLLLKLNSKILIFDISKLGVVFKHYNIDRNINKIHSKSSLQIESLEDNGDYLIFKENIFILKRSGVININKLNIAFLNGLEPKDIINETKKEYTSYNFSLSDIGNLLLKSKGHIDVFLTNCISETFSNVFLFNHSDNMNLKDLDSRKSKALDFLISKLCPRYTISTTGLDFYYEINPFLSNKVEGLPIRIIHLAVFNSTKKRENSKEKSMYALNIEPLDNLNNLDKIILVKDDEKENYMKCNIFSQLEGKSLIECYLSDSNSEEKSLNINFLNYVLENELFIGNLDKNVKKEDLENLFFSNFKIKLKEVFIPKNNSNNLENNSINFAFVKFGDSESINEESNLKLDDTEMSIHSNQSSKLFLLKQILLSFSEKLFLNKRKIIIKERTVKKYISKESILKINELKSKFKCSNDFEFEKFVFNLYKNEINRQDKELRSNDKSTKLSCWFCFDINKIDMSLVINEYNNFYTTLAKGGINEHHYLIIPKTHICSVTNMNQSEREEVKKILNSYKSLLNYEGLDYIYYEKHLPYNDEVFKHTIINIIGIPKEYSFDIYDKLNNFFNKLNLDYQINDNDEIIPNHNSFYYNVIFPSGLGGYSNLLCKIPNLYKNNIDILRGFICKYLNKEENSDWRRSNVKIKKPEELICIKEKLKIYYK